MQPSTLTDVPTCVNCGSDLVHFSPALPPSDVDRDKGGDRLWRNYTCSKCRGIQLIEVAIPPQLGGWAAPTQNPHPSSMVGLWDAGD